MGIPVPVIALLLCDAHVSVAVFHKPIAHQASINIIIYFPASGLFLPNVLIQQLASYRLGKMLEHINSMYLPGFKNIIFRVNESLKSYLVVVHREIKAWSAPN